MATLRDIAEEVGVSVSAVSLVVNGAPGSKRISDDTADRIREKARELGYRPNVTAQRLARRKKDLIGVVTHTFSYSIALRRLEITIRALLAKGYRPLVRAADWSETDWEYAFDVLVTNNVAGAMIFGPTQFPSSHEIADQLVNAQIPTVSLDAGDRLPGAGVDRESSFYELARAAIGAGHSHIGYLDSLWDEALHRPRLDGIQRAIAETDTDLQLSPLYPFMNGSATNPPIASGRRLGFATGRLGAARFLQMDTRPSALLCYCDDAAIAFMHSVQAAGVRVPDDVAVFGFDGLPESSCSYPPLTTVAQPLEEISTHAVSALLDLIEDPDAPASGYKLVSGPLIVRESSGPIPGYEVHTDDYGMGEAWEDLVDENSTGEFGRK